MLAPSELVSDLEMGFHMTTLMSSRPIPPVAWTLVTLLDASLGP